MSTVGGDMEESELTVDSIKNNITLFKDQAEKGAFAAGEVGKYVLVMDRRVSFTTTFTGVVFDAKLKPGIANKNKKLSIVYTADGVDYTTAQEYNISASKNHQVFSTNFTLSPNMLWNFR